jgi:hypothetical protein
LTLFLTPFEQPLRVLGERQVTIGYPTQSRALFVGEFLTQSRTPRSLTRCYVHHRTSLVHVSNTKRAYRRASTQKEWNQQSHGYGILNESGGGSQPPDGFGTVLGLPFQVL